MPCMGDTQQPGGSVRSDKRTNHPYLEALQGRTPISAINLL